MEELLEKARRIKREQQKSWMQVNGVVAVGIGNTSDNKLGLIISVENNPADFKNRFPSQIEDVPVEIRYTGNIRAFKKST